MKPIKYTILLDPRTKKNHMTIAGAGPRCPVCGKPARQFVKQGAAYDEFASAAVWFLRPLPAQPISEPVEITYTFYMKTHRKVDQLNLEAAMDDILVSAKVIRDDNADIVKSHDGSRVYYDKENPRVEILIKPFVEEEKNAER